MLQSLLGCQTVLEGFLFPQNPPGFREAGGHSEWRRRGGNGGGFSPRRTKCVPLPREPVDTLCNALYSQNRSLMSVSKIQIGHLWKKNPTYKLYLVTRRYSKPFSTLLLLPTTE